MSSLKSATKSWKCSEPNWGREVWTFPDIMKLSSIMDHFEGFEREDQNDSMSRRAKIQFKALFPIMTTTRSCGNQHNPQMAIHFNSIGSFLRCVCLSGQTVKMSCKSVFECVSQFDILDQSVSCRLHHLSIQRVRPFIKHKKGFCPRNAIEIASFQCSADTRACEYHTESEPKEYLSLRIKES